MRLRETIPRANTVTDCHTHLVRNAEIVCTGEGVANSALDTQIETLRPRKQQQRRRTTVHATGESSSAGDEDRKGDPKRKGRQNDAIY